MTFGVSTLISDFFYLLHDFIFRKRYGAVLGSAVNPVLREGNSDRRCAAPVKEQVELVIQIFCRIFVKEQNKRTYVEFDKQLYCSVCNPDLREGNMLEFRSYLNF